MDECAVVLRALELRAARQLHQMTEAHARAASLEVRLRAERLRPYASHHAHALHAPYWWIKCAVGVDNEQAAPVKLYHRMLVWDIMKAPRLTRIGEAVLNPVLGKSLVVYAVKTA